MRAVVQDEWGPPEVLRIEEVEKPVPRDGEILIRIRASTVSQSDTHARAGREIVYRLIGGFRRPRWRTLGVELSGEVEAMGAGVSQFHVGDAVFGTPPGFRAHAEYICLRATGALALKPANITFEEAAAVCDGAGQALSTLRQAGTRAGQRLVIYGASGSLGTAAVQLAHEMGAHVTGVCSTAHLELVRSLGADEVVDYTQDDFRKLRALRRDHRRGGQVLVPQGPGRAQAGRYLRRHRHWPGRTHDVRRWRSPHAGSATSG